jgi:amidase
MAVRLPTLDQIDRLGSDFGLVLTADEIAGFQRPSRDRWPPTAGSTNWCRRPGSDCSAIAGLPARGIGKSYGAWYWKTNINTGAEGLLSGKKVAIKDNICVAGGPDDERLGAA